MMRSLRVVVLCAALGAGLFPAGTAGRAQETVPLVTGRAITPQGRQTAVGSFPANLAVSPDGKYVVVTNTGYREFLTVLSAEDGRVVSQAGMNGPRADDPKRQQGLYYGLAFGPEENGRTTLYVSHGSAGRVGVFTLDADGRLADTGRALGDSPGGPPRDIAGLALSRDGRRLYAVDNRTDAATGMKGSLSILDTAGGGAAAKIALPGFPFAVTAVTSGPDADRKLYVTSERDGVVAVVDPQAGRVLRTIPTGDHPLALRLDRAQARLFVANAGSDTVTIVDTRADRRARTVLLRPDDARGLPGATPTGLALAPDEKRLYVTLADMNAVAVVDLPDGRLAGYLPVGWYPTAVAVSPDGRTLFVANAKGVAERNPNSQPAGPKGEWGRYIQNILEGTVSTIALPADADLPRLTAQVVANNRPGAASASRPPALPRGIEHVIYIIKENRTYDQVLGDMPQGNGDPSLCVFGREVTPNLHALAERFALLDNFYCCAEVSMDGWSWSTSGMASEYIERNAPYNYSGRGRSYDSEGDNNGVPVDLFGIPDVARPAGGYLWDLAAKKGLSYRNYGFFLSFTGPADRGPDGKPLNLKNVPNKKALVGHTDEDFLQFDMTYADSDAWQILNAPCPKQQKTFGRNGSPSRFAEWKREFDQYVRGGDLPRLMLVRLPRDHTAGTSPGLHSPRAMVADNDYAVGQLVDAVSHSPFWSKTALFIVEDDAQNGFDHVDAHRSTVYVISPFVKRATVDHRFFNTDSTLRTMELLLGLPPMCQYDAAATPFDFFSATPDNAAPYDAILPPRRIVGEVNHPTAYRARESARLDFRTADAVPDDLLNDILWHALKGRNTPMPPIRYGLRLRGEPDRD